MVSKDFRKIVAGEDSFELGRFKLNRDGVYAMREDGNSWLSSPILPVKTLRDEETGELTTEIAYTSGGQIRTQVIDADSLQGPQVARLSRFGVVIDPYNMRELSMYLQQARDQAVELVQYVSPGWHTTESGALVYRLASMNEPTDEGSKLVGEYLGDFDLSSYGTLGDWVNNVKWLIQGRTNLEIALGVAFATIIAGYDAVQNTSLDIGGAAIAFVGPSSSGKSSALMAMLSVFGQPSNTKAGSLFLGFNSTQNAMVNSLSGNYGVGIGYDDIGGNIESTRFDQLIYSIGNGAEKRRLSSDPALKGGSHFATWVYFTGEVSLGERLSTSSGLFVRLLEFQLPFTENAEHAQAIKTAFSNTYGTAALPFANYLKSLSLEQIRQKFAEAMAVFGTPEAYSPTIGRVQTKIAVILMAIRMYSELFTIDVDEQAIMDVLWNQFQGLALKADIATQSYAAIMNWLNDNWTDFEDTSPEKPNAYGWVQHIKGVQYVMIYQPQFDSLLEELNLPDATTVLTAFKNVGMSKYESQRLYFRYGASKIIVAAIDMTKEVKSIG